MAALAKSKVTSFRMHCFSLSIDMQLKRTSGAVSLVCQVQSAFNASGVTDGKFEAYVHAC